MKKRLFAPLTTVCALCTGLLLCGMVAGCAGKTEETEPEETLTEVPVDAADDLDDAGSSTFGEELTDEEVEEALLGDDEEGKKEGK
jgi:hypothetical protein